MRTNPLFFIAEAGVNHNGDEGMALDLIDAAAEAGADAVKFQTAIPEEVISIYAEKADYQKSSTGKDGSQLDMVRKLHFTSDRDRVYHKLVERAKERNIRFLSSPFDIPSLYYLVDNLELGIIKLASGEVTNGPLLLATAQTSLPIILSTGMATLPEIEAALGVLAFGYLSPDEAPSLPAFAKAYQSAAGQSLLQERVTLLHCVTSYPAPPKATNLLAMDTMRNHFGLATGFSDHSLGLTIPIAAAARGACLIEKHFTLDKTLPGPDHAASLELNELKALVQAVRDVESALGNAQKGPQDCEKNTALIARRSLVARTDIRVGETFTAANVAAKRPADGISPMLYWDILGTKAPCDLSQDQPIAQQEK